MKPGAETRARSHYAEAVQKRNEASEAFVNTKLWEVMLLPWRPIIRFAELRHWSTIETARFTAGVKVFGAIRWLEIIEDVPFMHHKLHSIKGGKQ